MKKFYTFLSLLLISTIGTAQYVSPGTGVSLSLDDISVASPTTITVNQSAYTIHENITIAVSDTLLIDTDIEVLMDEAVLMTIQGVFIVDSQDVIFTASDATLPYDGFRFEEGSSIAIRNSVFENGGGLRVLTEDFLVEYSVFENIVGGGATTSAVIQLSRGIPVIQHNVFMNNQIPAVGSAANSAVSPYIFDNILLDNNLENSNRPQINLGATRTDVPTIIKQNIILGSTATDMAGGIAVANLVGGALHTEISDNVIAENRYGITIIGPSDDAKIFDNIIEANNTQNLPMQGGSGISLSSGAGGNEVQVYGNEFRDNLWGITVINSLINLGDGVGNPGGNIFADNGNNGEIYALYNNSSFPIMALHNCWIEDQLSTNADVEAVIFHAFDDATLGEVTYDPFICSLLDTETFAAETFSFYPNPATETIYFNNTAAFDSLQIYDMGGRLISSETIHPGENSVNMNLNSGLYLIKFFNNSTQVTKKLIIE